MGAAPLLSRGVPAADNGMSTNGTHSATGTGTFVISRSWSGYFVWSLYDDAGQVIETSATRYDSYESCLSAVERLKDLAGDARITAGTLTARS